ncbi:NUDIX hydrolase [Methylosarcina fibrata]|uniref:NUDIX hydrolase n=1 Tax=Methylosarcina fibrata TaxID=105972 RepID=UPI00039A22BB|nr:NUDIX hydrolase [Methylosarcina fibrata]
MNINTMKHIHPCRDDNGDEVIIHCPSTPSPIEAFADPQRIAAVVPGGKTPSELNGIPLMAWASVPGSLAEWAQVPGQAAIDEPPMKPQPGRKLSAGVVTVEQDGRFWVVSPTNAFGGYKATFPKGTLDPGIPPQAAAIKEAFEESGLQIEIIGWIGDFERSTSVTRYYFARRLNGNPAAMDWESQCVMLVPQDKLFTVLDHPNDKPLIAAVLTKLAAV